jgi:hypothetical protein
MELELHRPEGVIAVEVVLEAAIVIETRSDPAGAFSGLS